MTRYLALDLSIKSTGWALWETGTPKPACGTWQLAPHIDYAARAYVRLQRNIMDLYKLGKIDVVAFEEAVPPHMLRGMTNADTLSAAAGLAAHVMSFAEATGTRWKPINIAAWRRHFIGKMPRGTKTPDLKAMAMRRCRELGFDPNKHDAAEALGVLDYIIHLYGDTPPWRIENVLEREMLRDRWARRTLMGVLKWYKRDPDAALSGMMGLTLEERGAYNTVLDLLYTRDGNLPDDDRFIAGWLRVDVRVWRRIRDRLVGLGKLVVVDGNLTNLRATSEIDAALSRVGSARNAGHASARSRAAKSKGSTPQNNDLAPTDVATGAPTAVPTNHNHNQKELPEGNSMKRARPRAKQISPVIPDWVPRIQWEAFLAMRKKKGASPTDHAIDLLIVKLEQFKNEGHPPGPVLDQSTLKNWTDIYRLKGDYNGNGARDAGQDRRDGVATAIDDELEHLRLAGSA